MKRIFFFVFILSSCVSVNTHIENSTDRILSGIRNGRISTMYDEMGLKRFNEDSFGNTTTFFRANTYINKHKNEKLKYKIDNNSGHPPITVTVPLFDGFDSTNGLIKAKLILLFNPSGPYSKKCKLVDFYLEERVDVKYRKHLLSNAKNFDHIDSLLNENKLDSNLIDEGKKVPMW